MSHTVGLLFPHLYVHRCTAVLPFVCLHPGEDVRGVTQGAVTQVGDVRSLSHVYFTQSPTFSCSQLAQHHPGWRSAQCLWYQVAVTPLSCHGRFTHSACLVLKVQNAVRNA